MSSIRSKNTQPEMRVRKALHAIGFRYRLHAKVIGSPDIYLPKYRAVIFINGCFWHGHDCNLFKIPATRTEFWINKIQINRDRDEKIQQALRSDGTRICIVWECALRGKGNKKFQFLIEAIQEWLLSGKNSITFSNKWLAENYQSTSSK